MGTNFSLSDTYTPDYTSFYGSNSTPIFSRDSLIEKKPTSSFMGNLLGNNGLQAQSNSLGLANTAISGIGSLLNFYSMREQNKVAKDTLNFNKDMFYKKFDLYKQDRARKIKREDGIGAALDRANGIKRDDTGKVFERSSAVA